MAEIGEGASQLERFPVASLTSSERNYMEGVRYDSLPDSFEINPRALEACNEVWQTRPSRAVSWKEAARRAQEHFTRRLSEGDASAEKHLAASQQPHKSIIEFGQQFYLDGSEVVVGKVHQGTGNAVTLRNRLDGLPDEDSIIQIHKQPDDQAQSLVDIAGILADRSDVPKRCLYLVVGPNMIHLIFPTDDSPRIDPEPLYKSQDYAAVLGIDPSLSNAEAVQRAVAKYKLGYFSSPRSTTLSRV